MDDILKINYEKYSLDNGLEVILYPDKSLPILAANIWYRVGSANETKGKTGFAHLFEHMMFQGSKHVPKQMHFKYIQEAGGNLNGTTSTDRTNYYQSLPSNYLEMVLWLESDRMGFLIPALGQDKLDNQIDVVKNERRQRYDNAPYGMAWEIIFSNLYPENHPYHWPTIGYMQDISNITLSDVKDFFHTYYVPNNASLVIGGDINIPKTKELVQRYFGPIPRGNSVKEVFAPEVSLEKNVSLIHEDNVQLPRIYFAWHTTNAYTDQDAALDILSYILSSSKNSRLYKTLIFEEEIAQDISAFQHSAKYGGSFVIVATARPGISLDQIKEEVFRQLDLLIENGISPEEMEKAKNNIKASFIFSMQNLNSLVNHLNEYNFFLKDPDSFHFDLERYQKVDAEAIRKAAEEFLRKPYVELRILPKSITQE
ncbi:MAG: insulinase family protein [Ignavibacteria bacterium]|jgi:zinc protease|nr:insulinase family protein [Ignavibacteria bacterium]MCU7521806.1 insulinase family protein [Ignavibacteria bacterium]MCU7525964.1 insulinase family protein [Ignavibacteria bacterium]